MTDIIMVNIEEQSGDRWNLNLAYVVAVELGSGIAEFDTLYYDRITTLQTITLPIGGWQDALDRLKADFNTSPKVSDHLFIGVT